MKVTLSIIICVNDTVKFDECVKYIKGCNFDDISYEIKAIYNAKSMTSGYNKGMHDTSGKYKVYMHQDTFCTNKDMFQHIIKLFKDNPNIGLIGMIGGQKMHPSGMWSNSKHIFGGVVENSRSEDRELLPYPTETFEGAYKEVDGVDGLFISTQYDVEWREDLFTGWDFYDVSQCAEFIRKGYKVCVPNMHGNPWVTHVCGSVNLENYDKYRKIFLKEYSKDFFTLGLLYTALWNYNKSLRPYEKIIEQRIKSIKNALVAYMSK